MKSAARRSSLHLILVGALIVATATPTLAWSVSAPTIQTETTKSSPLGLRLLMAGPLLDVITILGVVVDDGVPF